MEGPVEQIGADADAGGDEGLRGGEAVNVLARAEVEREVATDKVGGTGVDEHRPGTSVVLA